MRYDAVVCGGPDRDGVLEAGDWRLEAGDWRLVEWSSVEPEDRYAM